MASIDNISKRLGDLIGEVQALADANTAEAAKQQASRDSAIQAANDAGLSVDAGALPSIGAADAQARYLTLVSLLQDADAQLDQIVRLTA